MKQAIIILPKMEEIEKLRKEYDRHYKKYKTHISLVYTFEVKDQNSLFEHIKESIKNIKPFTILPNRFYNSKNFVCFSIKSKDCWKLYKTLNTGILKGFENKEVKFQPHLTITVLKSNREARVFAKELNKLKIKQRYKVNSISLLTLKKGGSLKSVKNFNLKGGSNSKR